MKIRYRILPAAGLLILALLIGGCNRGQADTPATGPLTMPDYQIEISGVAAVFDDGTVILISDTRGPVVLGGEMNLEGIETGDRLTVYGDALDETFPARTGVKEMVLHGKGSVSDLPADTMETLKGLGYTMEAYENRELTVPEGTYLSITMAEAEELFRESGDYIILDVRRADEFAEGHIPGAINVANEAIGEECPAELPDPTQRIYIYCRSGNRSKQAAEKLVKLGYTNLVEFGGILDWTGEIER